MFFSRYNNLSLLLRLMQVIFRPQCIGECMQSSFGCNVSTIPWTRSHSRYASNIYNLSLSPGCHVRRNSLNQPHTTYFNNVVKRIKRYFRKRFEEQIKLC